MNTWPAVSLELFRILGPPTPFLKFYEANPPKFDGFLDLPPRYEPPFKTRWYLVNSPNHEIRELPKQLPMLYMSIGGMASWKGYASE